MVGVPWKHPRDKLGPSQGHPGCSADACRNSNSRGRVSAGETGHMTGQMGHVHGRDGTRTRGCPTKFFMFVDFSSPQGGIKTNGFQSTSASHCSHSADPGLIGPPPAGQTGQSKYYA